MLAEYVFQVDYLPGDGHPSDYGSRFILLQQEEFVLRGKRVAVDELYNHLAIFDPTPREKKECKRFMNKYHLRWSEIEGGYKIVDFRGRILPRLEEFQELIEETHNERGHLQSRAMYLLLSRHYVFPKFFERI